MILPTLRLKIFTAFCTLTSCVHRSLSKDAAKLLVHTFISSRADCCNYLLNCASSHVIHKMQAVMNSAARLICSVGRFSHITSVMRDELPWLPVQQRIKYKIALLVYKFLHSTGPSYLSDCCTALTEANLRYRLHSVMHSDLVLPLTRTYRLGPCSFGSSGPSIWNSLPITVRGINLRPI